VRAITAKDKVEKGARKILFHEDLCKTGLTTNEAIELEVPPPDAINCY
jgi:hypothetical protein